MIKTMHHNQEEYPELTQRQVYLPCSFFSLFHIVSKYCSRLCLLIYLFTESGMMQLIHHNDMWCNVHKFRNKKLDDKRKTIDCGITVVFQVTNVSSRSDRYPKVYENRYYGYLEDILECDFNSFKVVMFEVKWYRLWMNESDPERTITEHANGFTMVKGHLNQVYSLMFFKFNVSRSFTQRF